MNFFHSSKIIQSSFPGSKSTEYWKGKVRGRDSDILDLDLSCCDSQYLLKCVLN